MYPTQEIAEDALIEARINFDFPKGKGPVAVYQCEDCGQYHLTSRGTMNSRLAEHISSGKINLHKEANRWTDKIKKR